MQFVACELEAADPLERVKAVGDLKKGGFPLLILDTCQRLEVFGRQIPTIGRCTIGDQWRDAAAFERLARVAAGLESRILGELEILGQVRAAYREFSAACGSDHTRLDRIFQDALALAREARRESGVDKNLTSLGALAARELMSRVPATSAVAVIGSGSLAGSVARYLKKRGRGNRRVS